MKDYGNEAPDLDQQTIAIYKEVLHKLSTGRTPVLIGGGLALRAYMPYSNDFGDLDIFCAQKDYPKILKLLSREGFEVWVKDEAWIAKGFKKKAQADVIFGSPNGVNKVDKSWFAHSRPNSPLGEKVSIIGPEHLLWCKLYVQNLDYFAGPDINHLLLKTARELDWKLVLKLVGEHWELLYSYLVNFCFVYPSKRKMLPDWLLDELAARFGKLRRAPAPHGKVCRGRLLSGSAYEVDFAKGGFKQ